jgi:NAD(P)H dehydrogenase (quinone)
MVDAPVKIVVVYHSGYDHAARLAEAIPRGAAAISGASVGLVTAEEAPGQWCIGVKNLIKRYEAYT